MKTLPLEGLAARLRTAYWESTDPGRANWEDASYQSRADWRRVARLARELLLGDEEPHEEAEDKK